LFAYETIITSKKEFYDCLDYLKSSSVYLDTDRTPEKWICETLFENIRKKHFQNHPSRIYGTYLCKTLADAKEFKRTYRPESAKIFEVEISDVVNFYDMSIFTKAESIIYGSSIKDSSYEICIQLAFDYWNSQNNCKVIEKEYLYGDALFIGKEIIN